jgi:hypothetical protein
MCWFRTLVIVVWVSSVPALPAVPCVGREPFRALLLCWILSELETTDPLVCAVRDFAARFNRMDLTGFQQNLNELESAGWLKIERIHSRSETNRYSRGPKFRTSRHAGRLWAESADLIFGEGGLLVGWVPPEAWGRSCLGAYDLLVLGVLRKVDCPVSISDLEVSLAGWISPRSSRKRINRLATGPELVEVSADQLVSLRPRWQAELAEWIAVHPSCVDQLVRRTNQTRRERDKHRSKIASGRLTDSEEREMKRQPCVFCGRRFPREQMTLEHWPPRKFMRQHGIPDSAHVVWPMCKGDNDWLGKFIQHKLPETIEVRRGQVHGVEVHKALGVFLAVAEVQQARYFDAFRRGDADAGAEAVKRVVQAWFDLAEQRGLGPHSTGTVSKRRRSGRRTGNYLRPGFTEEI